MNSCCIDARGWDAFSPSAPPRPPGAHHERALGGGAVVLDRRRKRDSLYAEYLQQCAARFRGRIRRPRPLLVIALGSPLKAARILAPLVLAVLAVSAALALAGERLTSCIWSDCC